MIEGHGRAAEALHQSPGAENPENPAQAPGEGEGQKTGRSFCGLAPIPPPQALLSRMVHLARANLPHPRFQGPRVGKDTQSTTTQKDQDTPPFLVGQSSGTHGARSHAQHRSAAGGGGARELAGADSSCFARGVSMHFGPRPLGRSRSRRKSRPARGVWSGGRRGSAGRWPSPESREAWLQGNEASAFPGRSI